MGGVSADGRVLWLTGRYNGELYAISTRTGRLLRRIRVGQGPHGACVWPQPGRYSIGHTGAIRQPLSRSAAAVGDDEIGEHAGGEAAGEQDQPSSRCPWRRMPCQISPIT